MGHIAPKLTYVTAGSSAEQIESGNSVIVYGIIIEGTSAGQVTFLDGQGTTTLFTMSVPADGTSDMHISFRADAGLSVTTPAAVTATVFHSQAGG